MTPGRFIRMVFLINLWIAAAMLLLFDALTLLTGNSNPLALGLYLTVVVSVAIWTVVPAVGLLALVLWLVGKLVTRIFDAPEPPVTVDDSMWDDALDGPPFRRLPTR